MSAMRGGREPDGEGMGLIRVRVCTEKGHYLDNRLVKGRDASQFLQ